MGGGTVGTAAGVAWSRAGHTISAVAGREATHRRVEEWLPGVPVVDTERAARDAEVIVVSVPDDAIPHVAAIVAGAIAPGTWVLHVSGATGLGVLDPVIEAGGRALALHPLQTFPDVDGALAALPGCPVAVTATDADGQALGEMLARDMGGRPFTLADAARPLYHAAAVFASNYLVSVSGGAVDLLVHAGIDDPLAVLQPLQAATLANVHRLGPAAALTGPAVRGDAGTVERNIRAIDAAAPDLVAAYVCLCRLAVSVAGERLSPQGRAAIEEVLDRWS